MRIPQPAGSKGSLKWLQKLVNEYPNVINKKISKFINLYSWEIEWLSPLKRDDYAEYRDGSFLEKLGLGNLKEKLAIFWPKGGPQWDALGKGKAGNAYFLIEAKANIPEIISVSKAKASGSLKQIRRSLLETQKFLNCNSYIDWESGFYQYANRIAHLYFLRELCRVRAYLIFLYFVNDCSHIRTSLQKWNVAIELQKELMGLKRHKLQKYVIEIFLDVTEIGNRTNG
jgi:hypothetical protein